jgi:hypothetical protein
MFSQGVKLGVSNFFLPIVVRSEAKLCCAALGLSTDSFGPCSSRASWKIHKLFYEVYHLRTENGEYTHKSQQHAPVIIRTTCSSLKHDQAPCLLMTMQLARHSGHAKCLFKNIWSPLSKSRTEILSQNMYNIVLIKRSLFEVLLPNFEALTNLFLNRYDFEIFENTI